MNEYVFFTVDDLVKSHTARLRQIDNQPSAEVRKELEMTACKMNVIGLYAQMLGTSIQVTSGYRCEELNKVVGGVKTSLHMQGRAVDFVVSDNKFKHELYVSLMSPEAHERLRICELIEHKTYIHIGFMQSH